MEAPAVGIVVFADVDLKPGEIDIDFATQRLPALPELRTVGLWCALHGDSFLQAGMHHLEARFNHPLSDACGIETPLSSTSCPSKCERSR